MLASIAIAFCAPSFQHQTTGDTFSRGTHLPFPVFFLIRQNIGIVIADFAQVKELFNLILLCNLVHF